ncbi:ferric-chelate reductase 1-like [Littorina saxatilis]|uniref:Ferric-chelate reductase 1 n=1 Tax=Littorina saxatilis TaxID=31220 RepID=A0AAN9BNU6_9CAEN
MASGSVHLRVDLPCVGMVTSVFMVVVMTTWTTVQGYAVGAPFSTCLTMFPKHGKTERQEQDPAPFFISLSPDTYRPGQVITVILQSREGRPFKGLQVKATRSTGDSESALGTFVQHPANITKVFSCEGGFKNMVTHTTALAGETSTISLNKLTLSWKAPETNVGNVVFVATFVENYEIFWTAVKSTLKAENLLFVQPPLHGLAPVTGGKSDGLDLSSCGTDKGCFLYPRSCSGSDCVAAVTFRQDGDHFLFEMMAQKSTYVSVGFSDDVIMGKDETVICTSEDQQDVVSVQHGFNPELYNQRIVRHQLSGLTVERTDGNIMCTFRRPRVTVTRFVNQSASELQYINTTYDLEKDYYLMLAWGTVKLGSDVINKHKELPPVTDGMVSFQKYAIYRGSALPLQARIHASLMVVAWVFVAGLTTVMSRYYKHWLSDRAACGTGIWFQVHRAAGITVGALTISSVVLIVVYIGEFAEKEQEHAIVGFTVLSLVVLQMLGGMLRPDKASSLRPFFKWGHMFMGQSAHILSAVAMYLAFNIRYIPAVMQDFGVAVLTGWVPVQIAWTIVLELRRCCTVGEGNKGDARTDKEPLRQALKHPDSLLLFFYCLTLLLLAAATLSAIHAF